MPRFYGLRLSIGRREQHISTTAGGQAGLGSALSLSRYRTKPSSTFPRGFSGGAGTSAAPDSSPPSPASASSPRAVGTHSSAACNVRQDSSPSLNRQGDTGGISEGCLCSPTSMLFSLSSPWLQPPCENGRSSAAAASIARVQDVEDTVYSFDDDESERLFDERRLLAAASRRSSSNYSMESEPVPIPQKNNAGQHQQQRRWDRDDYSTSDDHEKEGWATLWRNCAAPFPDETRGGYSPPTTLNNYARNNHNAGGQTQRREQASPTFSHPPEARHPSHYNSRPRPHSPTTTATMTPPGARHPSLYNTRPPQSQSHDTTTITGNEASDEFRRPPPNFSSRASFLYGGGGSGSATDWNDDHCGRNIDANGAGKDADGLEFRAGRGRSCVRMSPDGVMSSATGGGGDVGKRCFYRGPFARLPADKAEGLREAMMISGAASANGGGDIGGGGGSRSWQNLDGFEYGDFYHYDDDIGDGHRNNGDPASALDREPSTSSSSSSSDNGCGGCGTGGGDRGRNHSAGSGLMFHLEM